MKNKLKWMMAVGMLSCSVAMAQQQSDIMSVSASTNVENAALAFDKNMKTMWTLPSQALKSGQWLMFTIPNHNYSCKDIIVKRPFFLFFRPHLSYMPD